MPNPRKRTTQGGDPNCRHHYILDKPRWMSDIKFFFEHGICKLCGAETGFLRPEYPEFEDTIVLASEAGRLPDIRDHESALPESD